MSRWYCNCGKYYDSMERVQDHIMAEKTYGPDPEEHYMAHNTTNPEDLISTPDPSPFSSQIGGDHYKNFPIQPAQFCEINKLSFLEGTAITYICRHRFKNGEQDIDKAIHTLQLLKETHYKKE